MSDPKPLPEMSLEIALEQMQANAPVMIEYEKLRAIQLHARYKALIKAGFTDVQALDLVSKLT